MKSSSTVAGSQVVVHRCRESHLYFPAPLASLSIQKSSFSTVFTGPVSPMLSSPLTGFLQVRRVVRVSGCSEVTVVTAARRVVVQDCKNIILHLFTPNRPVLGRCRDITLAPFNANYKDIEQDFEQAGLERHQANLWDQPIVLRTGSSAGEVYRLLEPRLFTMFCLPTTWNLTIPFTTLPDQYNQAVLDKMEASIRWGKLVAGAELTPRQRGRLDQAVSRQFRGWVASRKAVLEAGLTHLATL